MNNDACYTLPICISYLRFIFYFFKKSIKDDDYVCPRSFMTIWVLAL